MQEGSAARVEHDGVSVQACRSLFIVLGVLLLHQLVLRNLSLGSLLLARALDLLFRDWLLVIVILVDGGLALATFLGCATLSLGGLALL